MSEPNVLVNFRLDSEHPMKLRWLATDGVPGDGYKPQIVAIKLSDGYRLALDSSAIVELVAPDPQGGRGAYLITFNGMVGYTANHPDRARIDRLDQEDIDYDLELIHDDDGRVAIPGEDYQLTERPRARATKLSRRDA
jgi:hypothetical protein